MYLEDGSFRDSASVTVAAALLAVLLSEEEESMMVLVPLPRRQRVVVVVVVGVFPVIGIVAGERDIEMEMESLVVLVSSMQLLASMCEM